MFNDEFEAVRAGLTQHFYSLLVNALKYPQAQDDNTIPMLIDAVCNAGIAIGITHAIKDAKDGYLIEDEAIRKMLGPEVASEIASDLEAGRQ